MQPVRYKCVHNTLMLAPAVCEVNARTKCSMAVHQTLSLRESRVWPRETKFWGGGGGQVQIWTVTKTCYRADSIDYEGGTNDGTILFYDMLAI